MLDIQTDLRKRLCTAFPSITVSVRVPERPPKRFVTISREGGRRENRLIDSPGIGILCWAESEAEASSLANAIADFIDNLSFEDGYADVYQEAAYSAPDPITKKPRWRMSYTIKTYQPKGLE